MLGFAQMATVQNASAATVGNPVHTTADAPFPVRGEGAVRALKVKAGGGSEPREPGRTADRCAGEDIVSVQDATLDEWGGVMGASRHGGCLWQVPYQG